ncbi:MAG: Mov34/MPN/PAD-1 family protein [Oscillospiraceae bacterium]
MQNESFDICVKILPKVINELKDFQLTNNFEKEYGGILIGLFDVKENAYIITDITWPQKEDIQKKFRFIRKDPIHQSIMDDLWKKSDYLKCYMGEWHSHREAYPSPSYVDRKNWQKSARRQNNFDVSFFIIVGRKEIWCWISDGVKIIKTDIYEKGD